MDEEYLEAKSDEIYNNGEPAGMLKFRDTIDIQKIIRIKHHMGVDLGALTREFYDNMGKEIRDNYMISLPQGNDLRCDLTADKTDVDEAKTEGCLHTRNFMWHKLEQNINLFYLVYQDSLKFRAVDIIVFILFRYILDVKYRDVTFPIKFSYHILAMMKGLWFDDFKVKLDDNDEVVLDIDNSKIVLADGETMDHRIKYTLGCYMFLHENDEVGTGNIEGESNVDHILKATMNENCLLGCNEVLLMFIEKYYYGLKPPTTKEDKEHMVECINKGKEMAKIFCDSCIHFVSVNGQFNNITGVWNYIQLADL